MKRGFRDFIDNNILPVLVLDYIISVQVPIEKLLLYIHMTELSKISAFLSRKRSKLNRPHHDDSREIEISSPTGESANYPDEHH